jgi:hypothetical protein
MRYFGDQRRGRFRMAKWSALPSPVGCLLNVRELEAIKGKTSSYAFSRGAARPPLRCSRKRRQPLGPPPGETALARCGTPRPLILNCQWPNCLSPTNIANSKIQRGPDRTALSEFPEEAVVSLSHCLIFCADSRIASLKGLPPDC